MSPICLLAVALLTVASARASAREIPFLPAIRSASGLSPAAPWEAPERGDIGATRPIDSTTLAYEVVAYLMKEFLDDASDEYRGSPVGVYLRREALAENSRSTQPWSKAVPFVDSPANLRYRVRGGTTLVDMWSALRNRAEADRRGLSFNPKFAAGKAGFVLGLRW